MHAEELSSQEAEERAQEVIPEKPGYWHNYLINNRREKRPAAYRIPFTKKPDGRVFYNVDEFAKFLEFEKRRRIGGMKLTGRAAEIMRAFGIGEAVGSTLGRKLNLTSISAQIDQATGRSFVQIISSDPLMVYRVEPGEATAIAEKLTEAAGECERASHAS